MHIYGSDIQRVYYTKRIALQNQRLQIRPINACVVTFVIVDIILYYKRINHCLC